MENETQELERMNCSNKDCTVEHDLKSYPTIKTLLIASFALIAPLTGLFMYVLTDAVSDAKKEIQLQLMPMKEKDKQNELRIVRVENSQLKSQETSSEILTIVRDIKTDLKYTYPTKKEMEVELAKKVDLDRMNKQYLTK